MIRTINFVSVPDWVNQYILTARAAQHEPVQPIDEEAQPKWYFIDPTKRTCAFHRQAPPPELVLAAREEIEQKRYFTEAN